MKKGAIWPFIIAGALGLHVVGSLIFVFIATSDPSYAVEEDYYQKAMNWDQKRAQDRTNASLGWIFEFTVSPPDKPGDEPLLEASLHDAAGEPLTGAVIAVEAFHNAHSDDILRTVVSESGEPGIYRATMPMQHNGRWELRFTVDEGEHRLTHTETRHLFVEGSWQ